MAEPLLFISHKHSDRAIAEVVARFIESEARDPIRVYLSSNPRFEGPKFGKDINKQLCSALWQADALILIYTTSEDQDWSWCMWECGVANDPSSPETTMIVFQCGSDSPKIFAGSRVVNVRKLDEVQAFVKQYFTDPTFYPSMGRALAPHFTDEVTKDKASDLYNDLQKVLPQPGPAREWPTWPFLRLELPLAIVERIKDLSQPISLTEQIKTVKDAAMITTADSRALEIFGLASLNSDTAFMTLARLWKSAFPSAEALWFENCCEQVVLAAAEKLLKIHPISILQIDGHTEFLPIVTRVRRVSAQSVVYFDIYFFDIPLHRRESVASKMLTLDRFYWKRLDLMQEEETTLLALNEELKSEGKNRLPLLDENLRARYIIHRSKIEEFIVSNLSQAGSLTLKHLLQDDRMRTMFERTFAMVGRNATLEEAKLEMRRIPDCRDVFVTSTGASTEPVLGWLTNVDFETEAV